MVRRRPRAQPLAQFVEQLDPTEPGAGQSTPIPDLSLQSSFTDASGVTWTRRGGLATAKRLRKLLGDPTVRVLHDYLGETTEVPAAEREGFWTSAHERMRGSAYSEFRCQEFTSETGGHLLVVHEDC